MSDVILETRSLTKKYGNFCALDNVSVSLKKNHIYGFIGENGAGKSTFMKIISGLVFPTSGDYSLMGADDPKEIDKKRKQVGTMIEEPALYPKFTVHKNVELQRLIVGNPDASYTDKVLELVGLSDVKNKKAKDLSMGMKQRLGIAIAMVGNPQLLILDEPINGLDPKNIVALRNMLKKINEEKECTVFVSSHILSVKDSNIPETVTILEKHFPDTQYKVIADDTVKVYGRADMKAELSKHLMEAGIVITELSEKEQSLEEYFMALTGGETNV